jgi:hypothetical protein
MQLFDIRHHRIGMGGVVMTHEDGDQWYVVPTDNDGAQHRAIEVMTREARRPFVPATSPDGGPDAR